MKPELKFRSENYAGYDNAVDSDSSSDDCMHVMWSSWLKHEIQSCIAYECADCDMALCVRALERVR